MFMTWETRWALSFLFSYPGSNITYKCLSYNNCWFFFLLSFQLNDKYQEFVTASERDDFTAKLQEVEDWLYDEGEDETKGVYTAKLEELKKVWSFVES